MCLLAGRTLVRREIELLHGDGMADNLESGAKIAHPRLGGCIIVYKPYIVRDAIYRFHFI